MLRYFKISQMSYFGVPIAYGLPDYQMITRLEQKILFLLADREYFFNYKCNYIIFVNDICMPGMHFYYMHICKCKYTVYSYIHIYTHIQILYNINIACRIYVNIYEINNKLIITDFCWYFVILFVFVVVNFKHFFFVVQ